MIELVARVNLVNERRRITADEALEASGLLRWPERRRRAVALQALRVLHLSRTVEWLRVAVVAVEPALRCQLEAIRDLVAVIRNQDHKSLTLATRRAALEAESIVNHTVAPAQESGSRV
jgi:hypothetical protein